MSRKLEPLTLSDSEIKDHFRKLKAVMFGQSRGYLL